MTIKEAREAAGLSQQGMSVLLEIPKRTIENWELGQRVPPKYVERLVVEKLQNLKKSTGGVDVKNSKKMDYAVIEQMEIIREFSSDLFADIMRYMVKNNIAEEDNKNIVVLLREEISNIRKDVYNIKSLKEAYEVRGKLQIVNDVIQKLSLEE